MILVFTKYSINDCIHCDRIADAFDDLHEKYPQYIFQNINVSDNPVYVEQERLDIFPTIICKVINGCDEEHRISGVISPTKLNKFVEDMQKIYGE